ncbi:MAG TPA: hypothetical protein VGN26_10610 [Armatimonadota bacterium]|jgi:MYXO-CTERM domain-containing protein
MARRRADQDGAWKEVLDRYFREFLELLFPQAAQGIDWSHHYEPLDAELRRIARGTRRGRRSVDKLLKVWLLGGEEAWVLVHIEVQGRPDPTFPQRMYVYHYRIQDRYDRQVASLALLTDDSPLWRPGSFEYTVLGCTLSLSFPVAKLLDWEGRKEEPEASTNPFSLVLLAALEALRRRRPLEERYQGKLSLVRALFHRGYPRERIGELLRFLDWIVELPEPLEERLEAELVRLEQEDAVPYVTSFERVGYRRGRREGLEEGAVTNAREAVIDALEARFGAVPPTIRDRVAGIDDLVVLRAQLRTAVTTPSSEEFLLTLPGPPS